MDEAIRRAEFRKIREMAAEIRKNGDAGASSLIERATMSGKEEDFELLEDALDVLYSNGGLVYYPS
jgi:hypothetical protein